MLSITSNMSDIPALLLLDGKIKDFHKLQEPPTNLNAADAYTANLKKVNYCLIIIYLLGKIPVSRVCMLPK